MFTVILLTVCIDAFRFRFHWRGHSFPPPWDTVSGVGPARPDRDRTLSFVFSTDSEDSVRSHACGRGRKGMAPVEGEGRRAKGEGLFGDSRRAWSALGREPDASRPAAPQGSSGRCYRGRDPRAGGSPLAIRAGMSSARWLARNSITRNSARPFWDERMSFAISSIFTRLLPAARITPPSRGIFRPDHEEGTGRVVLVEARDVGAHARVDLVEVGVVDELYDEHGGTRSARGLRASTPNRRRAPARGRARPDRDCRRRARPRR